MSTERGKPPPGNPPSAHSSHPIPDIDVSGAHPKDAALEILQKELDRQKEGRKEERFYWVCALCVIVDILMFREMQTWASPVCISVIELLILISLGRRWGVDHIYTLTEKFLDKWDGSFSRKKD
jgi:hypothetical protein